MARQITSGTVEPAASAIAAHNETHRSVVVLEAAKSHYDSSEWVAGVEQVLGSFYSTPTALAGAIDVTEKACYLFDTYHALMSNAGSGLKIFAHKAVDTVLGGTIGPAGATLEQAMVTAWGPRCIELLTSLQAHMLNTGGVWHATADLFNSVGTLPSSITTKADLCAWTIVLRSVYEAHRVYGVGVQHTGADNTNTIASPPPDNSDDWDGILNVLIEVADELEDHVEDAAFHNAAMAVTYTVAAFPATVTTAFTRQNAYKAKHNTHLASVVFHEAADATYPLALPDATTIATYVALAAEIFTKQPGHFRLAPVTCAERGV